MGKEPATELNGGNPLDDEEELKVLFAVLDSFRQYRKQCHYNITHRRRKNLYALPRSSWSMLAAPPINILDKLSAVDDAIDCNADLADAIVDLGLRMFGVANDADGEIDAVSWQNTAKPNDLHKVHSTIRQMYRDWSAEGFKAEVEPILNLIVQDLQQVLLVPSTSSQPQLLLPGAGLGRLFFELCMRGYNVEGNEISFHQLIASNFVLNGTQRSHQYQIYPFATNFTNQLALRHQLRQAWIPDVHPGTVLQQLRQRNTGEAVMPGEMNMAAGDFLTSYAGDDSRGRYDAILTVYFIDTAPNLIRYIETIRHCLKDGGVWINVGPLLWHFDDRTTDGDLNVHEDDTSDQANKANEEDAGIAEPGSFELTDEEVLALVGQMGFTIVKHEHLSENQGGYIQDPDSMIQSRYRCSHWVARKIAAD